MAYAGVIDILQQYTFKKRAAKILKGLLHDATKLSTIEVGPTQPNFKLRGVAISN